MRFFVPLRMTWYYINEKRRPDSRLFHLKVVCKTFYLTTNFSATGMLG
ncbi:hypothetical protein OF66_0493 [Seleniivibrio woodruffii]|uniref:Uncharacterized protein n=1 Tax=Seleniivibrio woodruffii TaxID=1078050 RepID=A0A4V6NEH2_9BACT|nr:hypothetical protein C8D98_0499 [Seleniivibrio woodruffii]TVZ34892.1 hypothetical protein OF66_0493 [Seleniivibrio woodruffii]